jgi:hypothetical protein
MELSMKNLVRLLVLLLAVFTISARPQTGFTFTTKVSDSFTGANQNPLDPNSWLDYYKNWPGGEDYLMIANHVLETGVAHQADGQTQNMQIHQCVLTQCGWVPFPDQWMELKINSMGVPNTAVWEYVRQGVFGNKYDGSQPEWHADLYRESESRFRGHLDRLARPAARRAAVWGHAAFDRRAGDEFQRRVFHCAVGRRS